MCIGSFSSPSCFRVQTRTVGWWAVMSNRDLNSIGPLGNVELESGLSLVPRIKLLLTILRADKAVTAIDEWKVKRSLIEYFKSLHSVSVPEEDLEIRKFKDLKKRKREDPVARGTLVIRDLGFLSKVLGVQKQAEDGGERYEEVEKKFLEWRKDVVQKMDGMELNLEGTKFKLNVALPGSDDFEEMKKEWEEIAAFGIPGYHRSMKQQPDTIILRGVPSRWFAEPRVSSKPSMLVTHTIFSTFGKIRNLDVAEDNNMGKDSEEDGAELVPGLQCKIVVRFEKHRDFYTALKILSGRSLGKQGSRLKADYEVSWDKEGFFRNAGAQRESRSRWEPAKDLRDYRDEEPRRQQQYHGTRYSPDKARPKRFRE